MNPILQGPTTIQFAPKSRNLGGFSLGAARPARVTVPGFAGFLTAAGVAGLKAGTELMNKILPKNAAQGPISKLTGGFLGYKGK